MPCELSLSPICTENTQCGHLRCPKTLTRNIKESLAFFLPPLRAMVPTQYYHSERSLQDLALCIGEWANAQTNTMEVTVTKMPPERF